MRRRLLRSILWRTNLDDFNDTDGLQGYSYTTACLIEGTSSATIWNLSASSKIRTRFLVSSRSSEDRRAFAKSIPSFVRAKKLNSPSHCQITAGICALRLFGFPSRSQEKA